MTPAPSPGLTYRDAVDDWPQVPSVLVWEGADPTPPLVTIAVTTFNRPDLLAHAVRSALAQDLDRPFEVIVCDNDPASAVAQGLAAAIPELADRSFRYFVHSENMGVFGNFNRCIALARGEWVTILNDDDLLDPECLSLALAEARRDPSIDGVVPRKRWLDERDVAPRPARRSRKIAGDALRAVMFRGRRSRRIKAERFFWGAVVGNGGGFVFRKSAALAVGGFYPEEYPSADYWFYARFAARHHLRQHRAVAATIRKTGEQITTSSVLQQLQQGHRLQSTLAGSEAPSWWRRFIPLLAARHLAEFEQNWASRVTVAELEQALGISLPTDRRRVVEVARLLLRGF